MHELAELVTRTLVEELGDRLEAVYLYGSLAAGYFQPGESDINLMLVPADGTGLHAIRSAFLPIWKEHGEQLRRAPLVAERSVFERYLSLNPLLGTHLAEEAKLLHGSGDLLDDTPTPDPREAFARLSFETMQASAAIAPSLLTESSGARHMAQLRRLARRIKREQLPEKLSADSLLADIHEFLMQMLEQNSSIQRWTSGKRPTTSLLLPGLEGTYKELGNIVMSFALISREQLTATDWGHLSLQLKKHYAGLKIITSTQLRLIAELIIPLSVSLQRFQHEWGLGILHGAEIANAQLLNNAARTPADLLVDALPNAYLLSEDETIGQLIHDFQNRILNIHLEHELLGRLQRVEQYPAPIAKFDRQDPHMVRIDAIAKHLQSWIGYYMEHASSDA